MALVAGTVLAAGTTGAWPVHAAGQRGSGPAGPGRTVLARRTAAALPKGPSSARVYTVGGRVPRGAVVRLAMALGVPGPVVPDHGLWRAGGAGGPALQVDREAPGGWVYTRSGAGCGAAPIAGGAATAICYRPGRGGRAAAAGRAGRFSRGPAVVSAREARRSAAPVLAALGMRDALVDASRTAGPLRTVTADPLVGGLPTYGWSTVVQVAADRSVTSASGRLSRPVPGPAYPVLGAEEALARMSGAGRGATRSCRAAARRPGAVAARRSGRPAGGGPCGRVPLRVRRAVFGLSAQYPEGVPALVPSWLFRVAAYGTQRDALVAQPALDLRPGAAPGPPPAAAPARVRIESYSVLGPVVTLRFWGGGCSAYTGSVVRRAAGSVTVQVTAVAKRPGRPCPLLARRSAVRLRLPAAPGRDLVVRDAATGRPVRRA